MQKIAAVLLLLAIPLLFAACTSPQSSSQSPASAAPSSSSAASAASSEAQASPSVPEAEASSQTSAAAQSDGAIQIDTVTFDSAIEWDAIPYPDGQYSYEIPASWTLFQEQSDPNTIMRLFALPDADYRSNVVVEVHDVTLFGDKSEIGILIDQETFFAYITATVLDVRSLENIRYSVWEAEDRYVYIIDYDTDTEDGLVHQTAYYAMGFNGPVIVYATDFGDDVLPDVNEVARHIALTFAVG